MRFLDPSIILHAALGSRRPLTEEERAMKAECQRIMLYIGYGEPVSATAIQVSEMLNINDTRLG